ncbi:MAG: phage tail sheath protein, partial [Desulfovibrionaceae bacterium]|nr:phage tail sheath protein [Desulfovibrionaceae bacterium]
MATGYLHGVYTREIPTAILPARTVDTNVVFAVGTAPVDSLPDDKPRYIDTPRLYHRYDAFVSEMGWSEDWNAYTLCEVAESHFARYGAAPLVCVNVFDPAKHCTEDGDPDPSLVASADIIGGIDAATLKKTGLELVSECFPRFRLVPGSLLAPKFSTDPAVAVSMAARAGNINGLFHALALADVPTDDVPLYTHVPDYKERNNLTDKHLVLCWPVIALGERRYHLSTQLAGRISLTDSEAGGTPQVSPSNKRAFMD